MGWLARTCLCRRKHFRCFMSLLKLCWIRSVAGCQCQQQSLSHQYSIEENTSELNRYLCIPWSICILFPLQILQEMNVNVTVLEAYKLLTRGRIRRYFETCTFCVLLLVNMISSLKTNLDSCLTTAWLRIPRLPLECV